MEVREIPYEAWEYLDDIFAEEFESNLPPKDHGTFYGVYEDGKLRGFILCENIVMVGQIYTIGDAKAGHAKALIEHVRSVIPADQSVGAVASEPRFEGLFRSLGMDKIDGVLYRRG